MDRFSRWFPAALITCALTAAYTLTFPSASLWFVAGVVAHVALGVALIPLSIAVFRKYRNDRKGFLEQALAWAFWATLAVGAVFGLFLIAFGNTHIHITERWLHIGFSAVALLFGMFWLGQRYPARRALIIPLCLVAVIVPGSWRTWRHFHPNPRWIIRNPAKGFLNMRQESGKGNPFYPAGVETVRGNNYKHPLLPDNFYLDSKQCGTCHTQIYREWKASAHHFSSFNNQFYRQAIVYMQNLDGSTKESRWCAGCHDPAVLQTGHWNTPIIQQIHTPRAQAGLGCLACHAIIKVRDTLGNNNFTVQDPPLHSLAESTNPIIAAAHKAVLYLNPTPHDRVFLKPFMHNQQVGQFCSVCHKVHLDVPVNGYRWIRGFDEYDAWQASGTDWQGARSFYYPPKPKLCVDCHMPLVRSNDPAAVNGFINSHRFAAANSALPYVNHDKKQLQDVKNFLHNAVSTDIFAIASSEGEHRVVGPISSSPVLATTFAQGEESGNLGVGASQSFQGGKVSIIAPLNETRPTLKPGDSVRIDVVERTLKLGHFFPGGTIDAFDVWVDFKALDGNGKPFFWSGKILKNGDVDPGAEFYRAVLIDAHGNPINKRDVEEARSVIYVHLIPPGAADTVRYRVKIPKNVKGPITFVAKLKYRKFTNYYTKFSYAMNIHPGPHTLAYDDRKITFDASTADVSGKIKHIPTLPVITISRSRVTLNLGKKTQATAPAGDSVTDMYRWNDYGIGLLLEGDLTGAEAAFKHVTQINPKYADGWLNVGRVLIREGETKRAMPWVMKALSINPSMGRAHYFRSLIYKTEGRYDLALKDLYFTHRGYPRDGVVMDQIGHILFLQGHYKPAVQWLNKVILIDPENIKAHYNLMLAYRGMGDRKDARFEEKLYNRFRADTAATALAGPYLRKHPNQNNDRQPIHEHTSIPLSEMGDNTPVRGR